MEYEEDELDKGLLSKALGLFEDVSHYNPADTPTNGFEYLQQVIHENSKLPKTVSAKIDRKKFVGNQTFHVADDQKSFVKEDLLPSQEWQVKQVRDFSKLRERVTHMKGIWTRNKFEYKKLCELPSDIDDDKSWLSFCTQSQPLLPVLFSVSQSDIKKLLYYFGVWIAEEELHFCQNTSLWLYSIFACLHIPLWPGVTGDMRNILRLARNKRSTIESAEDELLPHLNIIICIGARYFSQHDLSD